MKFLGELLGDQHQFQVCCSTEDIRAKAEADRAEAARRATEEFAEQAKKPGQATGLFSGIGLGLKIENEKLCVDTADTAEKDNTRPITSAAVYSQIGNIDALLESIL